MILPLTEDDALCRILIRTFKKEGKEGTCLTLVRDFLNHKNFDKTVEELAKILETDKEKIMETISSSCIPCETEEKTT